MAKKKTTVPDLREMPLKLGPQCRAMSVDGYDPETHTVEMAISSEQPVERYFGTEILSHKPEHIRQTRLKGGFPLLFNHDHDRHLGTTTGYEIKGGKIRTTNRFGTNPLAKEKEQDVADKILKDVSLAYVVHKYLIEEDGDTGHRTATAIDWEPLENSLVTIPADTSVGVGRAGGQDEIPVEYVLATRSAEVQPEDDDEAEEDAAEVQPEDEEDEDEDETGSEPDTSRNTKSAATRSTMAIETKDLAAENKERIKAVRDLRTKYPEQLTEDAAMRAIEEGTDVRALKDQIADAVIEGSKRTKIATVADEVMGAMSAREQRQYSLRNVYCAAVNQRSPGTFKDKDAEAGLEREVSQQLVKKAEERGISGLGSGIVIPSATTRALDLGIQARALAAGGSAGTASNVTVVIPEPIELLRSKTICLALGARMMTGLFGTVKMPRQNAAAQSNWLAEGGAVAESVPGFDAITIFPHRLSIFNDYYLELLAQSPLAVDAILAADRMNVLARSLDYAALNGPGTGNSPLGLLNQSGIAAVLTGTTRATTGVVTAGAGGVPATFVDLNDMESAISTLNGDIGTLCWATTPKVRAAMRSTPQIPGSAVSGFLFPNSRIDAKGVQEGPLGYNAIASSAVPTGFTVNGVAGLHALILGVWDQMLIGDWGLSEVIADPYTGAQQGLNKITEHALYDTNIRHVESFALCTSVLPS